MKLYKIFTGLLIGVLLFGLATIASADDPDNPPESVNDSPQPTSTPFPEKGSFAPVPPQNFEFVLDLATANVTRMELAEDDESLVPAAPPAAAPPPAAAYPPDKGSSAPGPIMMGQFDGETSQIIPNSADLANDLLIGKTVQNGLSGQGISAAGSSVIMTQDFEGNFPVVGWERSSTTGNYWDDVDCFPIESGGTSSAWAADDFSTSTPCSSNYVNNMNSWLIYGPFSLADAASASLDFYYRLASESGNDIFFWGASIGGNFYGTGISGIYTSGPFNNGYNFTSFDLTDNWYLGDLSGQPEVWIAFVFQSDSSVVAQGPFIDLISLHKNTNPKTYLIQDEGFDVFPISGWSSFDNDGATNGEYYWDDVHDYQGSNCPARSGGSSMWPADAGANGLDPCNNSSPDDYADDMDSWLVYGPFSLENTDEAWVDFYFRNVSELGYDYLSWWASTNGTNFYGYGISGAHTGGPKGSGYNQIRFDLSNVWTLGDLRGEPQVWIAFVFQSDFMISYYQGPFIDDVSIVTVEGPSPIDSSLVFLPVVVKSFPPYVTPKTNLYVFNDNSSGNITYYKVKNAMLDGVPIGDLICYNIPAQTEKFCGTLDAGPYELEFVSTNPNCTLNGTRTLPESNHHQRIARCPS